MSSGFGTVPLCLKTTSPFLSIIKNNGTKPPSYFCLTYDPNWEATSILITAKSSSNSASNLSTVGLVDKQTIQ